MLISAKATDTIYQEVLQLLQQQGVDDNAPIRQRVLLGAGMFLGFRFYSDNLTIDWLAQRDLLVLKSHDGTLLLQKQLPPRQNYGLNVETDTEEGQVAA